MPIRYALFPLCLFATPLLAEAPNVVTDIAPVASMVAAVMGDRGTPVSLLPAGASPHDFAFRPSDGAALEGADLVVWVGHELTPWLEDPLATLGANARQISLLDSQGWTPLPIREIETIGAHDHDHEDHDEHGHGATDPHAWLSPDVMIVWAQTVAAQLSEMDPEGAATYQANAAAFASDVTTAKADAAAALAPVADKSFVVSHDALQYFEQAFGLTNAGAIAANDAAAPGASHMVALRDVVESGAVTCILVDPQTSRDLVSVVVEGADLKVGQIDDQGAGLPEGKALYPALVRAMGKTTAECLKD